MRGTTPVLPGRLLAAVMLLAVPAALQADAIKLKNGLTYTPAVVVKAEDGYIHFRLMSGRVVAKPLSSVARIEIKGLGEFNRAEELAEAKKYRQAVRAYNRAESLASVTWQKQLIRYRLMSVAEAAGDIVSAVKGWLALADAAPGSRGVLALRPRRLPPKGSAANDMAINLLQAKLKAVKLESYRRAILELLVDLYERQGRVEEARKLAARLAGRPKPSPSEQSGPRRQPVTPPPRGSNEAVLKLARLSLEAGRAAEVVSAIKPRLRRFTMTELPTALYLLGAAQVELAGKEKDAAKARRLYLAGGLNLMRVVAYFPAAEEAPQALLAAGRVNEALGNAAAARAVYSELLGRYRTSPAAAKAKAALERLEKAGGAS